MFPLERRRSSFYNANMLKIFILNLFVFLSLACTSAPILISEPDWLRNPPQEEGWYYGIGGSNSGNPVKDRELALLQGRNDLAAAISVDIISKMVLEDKVSADGQNSSTLENRVAQSVEQSLMNLQTVEVWTNESKGTWVLLKMDKEEWERLRREDRRVSVPVPIGLEELSGLNVSFLSTLNRKELPLQLLPGGKNTAFEISMIWNVSDYPVLEDNGGIHFAQVEGIISFSQYGVLLYSQGFGPVKEGGLSYEQAHERAAVKVMDLIKEDSLFKESVLKELDSL